MQLFDTFESNKTIVGSSANLVSHRTIYCPWSYYKVQALPGAMLRLHDEKKCVSNKHKSERVSKVRSLNQSMGIKLITINAQYSLFISHRFGTAFVCFNKILLAHGVYERNLTFKHKYELHFTARKLKVRQNRNLLCI